MEAIRSLVVEKTQDLFILPTMKDQLKGLGMFISNIRRCKSKEAELKRINKELARIKSNIKGEKGMDGYQRKKYVAKLLFIYLLGYDIDIGHTEAITLISSEKFSEKSIGYMFISVTFGVDLDPDIMSMLILAIRNDINSHTILHSVLAIQTAACICCPPIVMGLKDIIFHQYSLEFTLNSPRLPSLIPCVLAFIRCMPDVVPCGDDDVVSICKFLKSSRTSSQLTSLNLLEEFLKLRPKIYQPTLATLFSVLESVLTGNERDRSFSNPEQYYYGFFLPWNLVKILRILQLYSFDDPSDLNTLKSYLTIIIHLLENPSVSRRSHHLNIKSAIIFETVHLVIQLGLELPIMHSACGLLMDGLNSNDPNLKGMSLSALGLMPQAESGLAIVEKLTPNIINLLKTEKDSGLRKMGFDVAYCICSKANVKVIVEEILSSLPQSSIADRQELALKVIILSEKYAINYKWYVDTILKLVHTCGNVVNENLWFRLIHVITNHEEVHGYAAQAIFEYIQQPGISETVIKLGGYILGEFGNLIANDSRSSPLVQLFILQSWFPYVSYPTKHILVNAIGKMRNLYPELKPNIEEFLSSESLIASLDVELQQRASEILRLSKLGTPDLMASVFDLMPTYTTNDSLFLTKSGMKSSHRSIEDVDKSLGSSLEQPVETFNRNQTIESSLPIQSSKPELSPHVSEYLENFKLNTSGMLFASNLIELYASVVSTNSPSPISTVTMCVSNLQSYPITNIKVEVVPNHESSKYVSVSIIPCHSIDPQNKGQIIFLVYPSGILPSPIEFYLSLNCNGLPTTYRLCLPVLFQNFIQPLQMTPNDFFSKWHALANTNKEESTVFCPAKSVKREYIEPIFRGFNLEILKGVDPDPINYCASGGFFTTSLCVGILIRLEVNVQASALRLTVRTTNDELTVKIAEEFSHFFRN